MDPATAQADEEDLRADAEAEAQAEMAAVFTSKPDVDEEPFDLKHEPSTAPPVPRLVFEADPDDVAPAPTAPVAVDAKPAKEPLAELFIRVAHPKLYARDSLKRAEAVSLLSKCPGR